MKLYFVTSNAYKIAEISEYFKKKGFTENLGIELAIAKQSLQEILHPDINVIVKAKVLEAYKYLGVPCAVEHGGIFINSLKDLPGGIGKIIWNAVGDRLCSFIHDDEPRNAVARSIIGYCNGRKIYTFTGETAGAITTASKGDYKFNWDPIFMPEGHTQTYGEMGFELKSQTSQSMKAWNKLVDFLSK